MFEIKQVGGALGGEAFLIMTKSKTALLDSGFSFSAPKMVENIKKELGERKLDYVLLTHSHYDHASGAPFIKRAYPDTQIIAGTHAAYVFTRPGARAVMVDMNDFAAKQCGITEYEDLTDSLSVDREVSEGDTIDMGDFTFKVIATPGHTKCSISFYSPEEKLLVSSETLGVPGAEDLVVPCCLVGYDTAVESIKKAQALDVEKILFPHSYLLEGKEECRRFFENSLKWHEKAKDIFTRAHSEGKTEEELVEMLRKMFYTKEISEIQPEKAFLLNAKYIIKCMIG